MYSYENAQPGHKGGPDGDYRYVGYKKHDAIDLLSGLGIATIFTSGNASDNVIGLELLKLVKQLGFMPKYVLADSGYDENLNLGVINYNTFDDLTIYDFSCIFFGAF